MVTSRECLYQDRCGRRGKWSTECEVSYTQSKANPQVNCQWRTSWSNQLQYCDSGVRQYWNWKVRQPPANTPILIIVVGFYHLWWYCASMIPGDPSASVYMFFQWSRLLRHIYHGTSLTRPCQSMDKRWGHSKLLKRAFSSESMLNIKLTVANEAM